MFIHVVLFTLKPSATIGQIDRVLSLGRTLGQDCGGIRAGIIFWAFNRSEDRRKEVEWVEVACFSSRSVLASFKQHPAHRSFVEEVKLVADWKVGDITI